MEKPRLFLANCINFYSAHFFMLCIWPADPVSCGAVIIGPVFPLTCQLVIPYGRDLQPWPPGQI